MEYVYVRSKLEMDAGQLAEEIKVSLGYDTRIRVGGEVWVQFPEVTLTLDEKTALDLLVAGHVAVPFVSRPDPPFEVLLKSPSGKVWEVKVSDQGKLVVGDVALAEKPWWKFW